QLPETWARSGGAPRPVPRGGARPPDGGGVHEGRPLAEGVAARRDPAALERPPRRHVVRRPAADPAALLRRARPRAAVVLAEARRAPRPHGLRAGAPRLRDVDGREARARSRMDRGPFGAAVPADARLHGVPRRAPDVRSVTPRRGPRSSTAGGTDVPDGATRLNRVCGICGIASTRGEVDRSRLAAMSATLVHRGP